MAYDTPNIDDTPDGSRNAIQALIA